MLIKHVLLFSLFIFQGVSQAQPANALPDNEQLCMESMAKMLIEQQVLFSDNKIDPDIRRAAERAIDTSREVFSENGSYCEAERALLGYKPDKDKGFRYRAGEVNFFGRGNI